MTDKVGSIVVVMGISGSGKSTVGRRLAERLGALFVEGDDHHPPANRAKMAAGHPLDDADRAPWLVRLVEIVASAAGEGRDVVLACSALRRRYRDRLREAGPTIRFVHLTGADALVRRRMGARADHFMPPALIDSQIAALEPPDREPDVLEVDVAEPPERLVERIAAGLATLPAPTEG